MNATASPLGLCILPEPAPNAGRTVAYPHYIHEVLDHAGLCYRAVPPETLDAALDHLAILVTVGDAVLPETTQEELRRWVAAGGVWIAVAGTGGLADLLGVTPEPPAYRSFGGGAGTLGEGYLAPRQADHPAVAHLRLPLHFFNGLPARPAGATVLASVLDAHQRETPRAALTERQIGQGRCLFLAMDLPGTLVRIQQGVGVTRDGVSAPDGTAPVEDRVLKSGDGGVLDWIFDRQPVPGVPGLQAFLEPVADLWRELLLRSIFHGATVRGVALPLLWLYPRNLPALAHISHDTDGNDVELGWELLEVVNRAGVRTTWCVILPGYPPELTAAIRDAGHELAMHYDSMTPGLPWSQEQFVRQWEELVALFGGERPVTNKNHYLRWEGDTELFRWCLDQGIQLDQSKGASKTGEAGFNFGTCHPYFPVDFAGERLDVLELCTPTQDLEVFAPEALGPALMEAVLRSHGVLHLLFHPAHIRKPGVAQAIQTMVEGCRAAGMAWWTAREINAWERARRQVTWRDYGQAHGAAQVTLETPAALPEATVLWLALEVQACQVNGEPQPVTRVRRWGHDFLAVTLEGRPGAAYTLTLE